MLRRNYVSMHAAVLYGRAVLEETAGFDSRLSALEDYDLYLRVTRTHPVACHDRVVAQYRRHPAAMSRDMLNMLRMALFVLREQRPYLAEHPGATEAYEEGLDILEAPLRQAADSKRAEPSRGRAVAQGRQRLPLAGGARGRR